ncbi:MAG TPA: archaellin/type IV pilin N-terminal domain-containing protein [Candidatus Nanoarchaeia archaeon]|nr:archaellin/type IV pilin N-terminal domain-containing protein [Candidatus Nanoarchaeia archaeon]
MINNNKKGISPLIATVLIIGFTIVLAALVITWGTRLFNTTVEQTEESSKFTLVCTTGLRLEAQAVAQPVHPSAPNAVVLRMKNSNQDNIITNFRFVVNGLNGASANVATLGPVGTPNTYSVFDGNNWVNTPDVENLQFPAPKNYGIATTFAPTSVQVYPAFTFDGKEKYCEDPIEVRIAG